MKPQSEGLRVARLLMLLSSISPLFIIWAIRGNSLIPERYFIAFCILMVVLPSLFLWIRIRVVKICNDKRELVIGVADDHRDHLLVYLFAMLLPFYSEDLGTIRDLAATLTALSFIVFLFWHLNLHYMNIIFALFGYRVFTVQAPNDFNKLTGNTPYIIITRRVNLLSGERVIAYRLSNTVYMELK